MGMGIRKKLDLPSDQGVALAALGVAFLLGGGVGCLLAALSGEAGGEELCAYLSEYLLLAQEGELPRSLWAVLWGQMKYLLAALLLSVTALGVAGLPILFWVRGFFFAFPAACFCRVFGGRGLLPAFILFGLPALLWVPALFVSGVSGFLFVQQLLHRSMGDNRGGLLPWSIRWYQAALCVGLVLGAGLLEYWVVPVLLRGIARVML